MIYQPAMAVRRILTKADIGDHKDLWIVLFDITDGLLGDTVAVISSASHFILMIRNTKQKYRRNLRLLYPIHLFMQPVDAVLTDPRHGRNGIHLIFPRHNKNRIDQIRYAKTVFPNQRAHSLAAS